MTAARAEATRRGELDPWILALTTSLPVDQALYAADIDGSLAHVRALEDCQILDSPDAQAQSGGPSPGFHTARSRSGQCAPLLDRLGEGDRTTCRPDECSLPS